MTSTQNSEARPQTSHNASGKPHLNTSATDDANLTPDRSNSTPLPLHQDNQVVHPAAHSSEHDAESAITKATQGMMQHARLQADVANASRPPVVT